VMPVSVVPAKSRRKAILVIAFLTTCCPAVFGQHGKSEGKGFYNFPYHGDTWTGKIVAFDRPTLEVTLQAIDNKQGQKETFKAKIKLGAKATVKERPGEKVNSLNVGDRIIAYYIAPGQKYPVFDEAGKKKDVVATENLIFEIEVFPDWQKDSVDATAPKRPIQVATPIHMVPAEYPDAAKAKGLGGKVGLMLLIDTEGTVKDVEVLSGDPALTQAAIDAVRKWRFKPPLQNGSAVESDYVAEIVFKLY